MVSHTHTYVGTSLALVSELFAVKVDPGWSRNKPGEEADGGAKTAGNRPRLREEGRVRSLH